MMCKFGKSVDSTILILITPWCQHRECRAFSFSNVLGTRSPRCPASKLEISEKNKSWVKDVFTMIKLNGRTKPKCALCLLTKLTVTNVCLPLVSLPPRQSFCRMELFEEGWAFFWLCFGTEKMPLWSHQSISYSKSHPSSWSDGRLISYHLRRHDEIKEKVGRTVA